MRLVDQDAAMRLGDVYALLGEAYARAREAVDIVAKLQAEARRLELEAGLADQFDDFVRAADLEYQPRSMGSLLAQMRGGQRLTIEIAVQLLPNLSRRTVANSLSHYTKRGDLERMSCGLYRRTSKHIRAEAAE